MEGQEAAQEVQPLPAPGGDRLVIVAVGDRAADDQQQNLRKRMRDPPRLARVFDRRKMIQKGAKTRLLTKLSDGKAHGGAPESIHPTESDSPQPVNRR